MGVEAPEGGRVATPRGVGQTAAVDGPGRLAWVPVRESLVAEPVWAALSAWSRRLEVRGAEIDPQLADTAAFCERYAVDAEDAANCVLIVGRRGEEMSYAACVVLATTRADVNGVVRRRLGARKASFAAMDEAVGLAGMEHGGITPIGLPPGWPVLIDGAVMDRETVVIGSGLRRSKLSLSPGGLAEVRGAEVIEGLASATGHRS
jgi:prolyl-tRNA editing enzyme YbaK/EbsC (Cys-tRNA(Pro) deacylase)